MDVWVYLAGSLSGADKLISRCGYLGRALRHRCGRHEELEQQNEGDEAILIFLKANVIGGEKAWHNVNNDDSTVARTFF